MRTRSIARTVRTILLAPVALVAGGWLLLRGWILVLACLAPFSWEERDWNGDGHVTPGEFVESAGIGKMPSQCPGGVVGTEYFDTKAGNPIRVDCARRWTGPREPRFV